MNNERGVSLLQFILCLAVLMFMIIQADQIIRSSAENRFDVSTRSLATHSSHQHVYALPCDGSSLGVGDANECL